MRINFVRLLVSFDIPQTTNVEKRIYRQYVKFLDSQGYLRIQNSLFVKLCINHHIAHSSIHKLKINTPRNGDIRYTVLSEKQYANFISLNDNYSFKEKIQSTDRLSIIGREKNDY